MVCRPGPPATNRAAWLATELLPRGCYIDFGDATIRTAILGTGMRPTLSSGAPACALNAALGRATTECGGS